MRYEAQKYMIRAFAKILIMLGTLALIGAQCISFGGGGASQGAGGGIFKSANRGDEWLQKVAIPTASGMKNFGGTNVTALAVDPQDHLAIYAGTRESGMFYSYDGGESWMQTTNIKSGFVATVAVDPKNKCVVYAATGNRIMKSVDCNRSFEPIYNESAGETFVTALSISPFNSAVLYAGNAKGALIKSTDGGLAWSNQGNLRGRIVDIVADPRNSSILYAAVAGRGVWKSENGGETFRDLSENMKAIKDVKDVRRLVADRATPNALLLASRHKLSRTTDGGLTWTALPIVSPETIALLALTVNPKNSKEIYYGTATTFYRSSDGGEKWSTEKLPTKLQASYLLVDPENTTTIYLGVLEVKK